VTTPRNISGRIVALSSNAPADSRSLDAQNPYDREQPRLIIVIIEVLSTSTERRDSADMFSLTANWPAC